MIKKFCLISLFFYSIGLGATRLPSSWQKPMQGNFIDERSIAGFTQKIRSEGRFVMDPKVGLTWRTLTPFPSTLHLTRDGRLTIQQAQQTMQQSIPPSFSQLFLAIFSGQNDIIARRFTITTQDTPNGQRFHLTPKTTNDAAWIQRLWLEGKDYPKTIDWIDPQGMKIHITLIPEGE